MASEFVASLRPLDMQAETVAGNDPRVNLVAAPGEFNQDLTPAGDIRGLGLRRYVRGNVVNAGYTGLFRIPANLTMGTGLTFKFYVTDDGGNAGDLGTALVVGLTVKRLAANATDDVDVSSAAEQTATITLSSTSAGVAIGSLAIPTASLPSGTAVGDLLMFRVRRVATNAADTCPGRPILLGIEVQNT